jgi:ATP-binding cassette subfamily B (MDR/TAP) protein 1
MASSEAQKTTRDWVVRVQSGDSQHPPWEAPPIERVDTAETPSSWRSLFAFTVRAHWVSIACSLAGSIFAGMLKPATSIFFGKIFSVLAKYGAGTMDAKAMLHEVSIWCIALTVLCISAWLAEGIFLSAWIIFGEIQAKTVREKMFAALLDKDKEWYDLREDGIGSLLIRIQT